MTKLDLGVKYVKVKVVSQFEYIIMGWHSKWYISSFIVIGPLVLEKIIFDGVLQYMGVGLSWSCDQAHLYKFSFLCSKNLSHSICFQISQQFLRKKGSLKNRVTFGEGQRMTLTFDTHVGSIDHLVQCMYQI